MKWFSFLLFAALSAGGSGCAGRKPAEVQLNPHAVVDEVAFAAALQTANAPAEVWVPLLERARGPSTVYVAIPLESASGSVVARPAQVILVDDGRVEVVAFLGEAHLVGLLGGPFETEHPRVVGRPADDVGAWASRSFGAWGVAAAAGDLVGAGEAVRALAQVLPLDAWAVTGAAGGLLRRVAKGELVVDHDHDPSRATPTTVLVLGEERRVLSLVEVAPERWVLGAL